MAQSKDVTGKKTSNDVTMETLAQIWEIKVRRCQQLRQEGIVVSSPNLKQHYDLWRSTLNYLHYLQRKMGSSTARINAQRELKIISDRELVDIKIAEKKKHLASREQIAYIVGRLGASVAETHSRLLADLKQLELSGDQLAIIKTALQKIRKKCAALNSNSLIEEVDAEVNE